MQRFSFQPTDLFGLVAIRPRVVPDERGCLMKSFEQGIFRQQGILLTPYEELTSQSRKGVIRGLHFQREHSQDKLVRVLHGAVYDVAVDLRRGSPTFGQWRGFTLSAENQEMLYIPKGFAHGFLALEPDTLFNYLCGDQYDPDSDGGIVWNDSELKISWPIDQIEELIISEKDQALPSFSWYCDYFGGL